MKKLKWLVVFPVFLLMGCFQDIEPLKQTFTVELGEDVYGNPRIYVKNAENLNLTNVEVISKTPGVTRKDNRFVTTGTEFLVVGEYDFVLVYNGIETPFKIKVKDTKAPTSKNDVTVIETSLNANIDWASYFNAADLSGVYYEAPADAASEVGENPVTVRIYDRFGNSDYKEVMVVVS